MELSKACQLFLGPSVGRSQVIQLFLVGCFDSRQLRLGRGEPIVSHGECGFEFFL
eukprot:TRINITY_DN868_c0_g1_i1.p2 TRINITY_DN868_c0_g1~~TRINITY_DN868_c0_g1_i1.p2  ORF type:complete len:55 (-),score=7.83 TRINITY_DN868_c0_g1_i1:330-494(-)